MAGAEVFLSEAKAPPLYNPWDNGCNHDVATLVTGNGNDQVQMCRKCRVSEACDA